MSARTFRRLTAAEADTLLQQGNVRLFDARDAQARAAGMIPGASHLGSHNLDQTLLGGDRTQPVLIYCYHGNASQTYAQMFADFGYQAVHDLIDGFEAWQTHTTSAAPHIPSDVHVTAWLATEGFPLDLNARIANRTTPLMQAAYRGNVPMVKRLLQLGVALEDCNADGNTALWLACVSDSPATVSLLVAAGCKLDHQNDNGATALMYAASSGKTAIVEVLLKAGASLAPQTPDGFTALDMAANLDCLQLLQAARRQVA